MLSEEFDKKIREAAEHHHPAYDEKAWKGMKQLLDKHLPEEEKKKRRFIFFILFFLLLGGGVWLATGGLNTREKKETAITAQVKEPVNKSQPENDDRRNKIPTAGLSGNDDEKGITINSKNEKEKEGTSITNNPGKEPFNPLLTYLDPNKKNSTAGGGINESIKDKVSPVEKDVAGRTTKPVDVPVSKKSSEDAAIVSGNKPGDDMAVKNHEVGSIEKSITVAEQKEATEKKSINENRQPVAGNTPGKEENKNKEAVTRKPKQGSAKKSAFFLSASFMPDVSFTGNDPLGKMKFLGGAGIGYTFRDKFTLRTGFYSGRKVYQSSPEQYNPPPVFYTYYPHLEKVEADCKVYEIPVLFSYQFGQKNKHNWFASAGLSTLIMKRETYDYYYKYTPTGPVMHRAYTFNNENSHLFSLATVSAGYQRHIGKRVSLTAEPYFKFPFSGVGYGKVKLNSTGVMFTLAIKPFQSSVKK